MLCFVDEKLQKLQSGWGSAPDPDGGAYSAPPYPLAGREGATPPAAPTPALTQFHLIAFPNPPVSRPAYGPVVHIPTLLVCGHFVARLTISFQNYWASVFLTHVNAFQWNETLVWPQLGGGGGGGGKGLGGGGVPMLQ